MQRRDFVRTTLAAAAVAPLPDAPWLGRLGRQQALVRLGSNENPLGVPDAAKRAILDALVDANRYPRGNRDALHARIAARHGVQNDNLVLGNGSSEILQMVVQALTVQRPGARVVIADPTFEDVEQTAAVMGAEVVKVPLSADYAHDLQGMQAAVAAASGPVLAFICNPNNPTGTLTSCEAVARWVAGAPPNVWFLIDEAYFEFVTDPSYRTFIAEAVARPRTVVSRTLSKIYGLAGIRLGYGIGEASTMRQVNGFRAGTNVNHLAIAAGHACLGDEEFLRRSLRVNAEGKEFVYRTLRQLGLDYLPTHANFVMHRIGGGLQTYIAKMLEHGVRVGRPFPPMVNYNRVSIGLPAELQKWADTLADLRSAGIA